MTSDTVTCTRASPYSSESPESAALTVSSYADETSKSSFLASLILPLDEILNLPAALPPTIE